MKIWLLALMFIHIILIAQNEKNYISVFAINFQPNYQDLITYFILKINDKGEIVDRTILKRDDWVRQIVGLQSSIANPEGKNLMKEVGINGPEVLSELWKLRYSEHPYDRKNTEKGWASKPRCPSPEQMKMLEKFGMKTLSDYIYGENLLKLLKAMEDPAWVAEYQSK
ncbi:MAG: hypothetical protein N3A01_04840 [Bacteroidales bacterium]|nr:hypothetical protein [Bacteroidales bacterium]